MVNRFDHHPPPVYVHGLIAASPDPRHRGRHRAAWYVGGELKLATVMAATASFNQRAIDGAIAAQFMAAFKGLVEQPLGIAV